MRLTTQPSLTHLPDHSPGTIFSIYLLTFPVLFQTTTSPSQLLRQWQAIYLNGHRKGPIIALVVGLLHILAAREQMLRGQSGLLHGVAAATTVGMIPYTWIFMLGVNEKLFRMVREADVARETSWEAVKLWTGRWNTLNAVRALCPIAGAVIGLCEVLRR